MGLPRRFIEWHSRCIVQELHNGKEVDSIDIQLKIAILSLSMLNG